MASSPSRSKARFNYRAVSLPSRPHPLLPQFDVHLPRARTSEATSSSLSSIGLECQEKWVEEALDRYLKLVDMCAMVKDVFSQMKQDVQDLGSVLRSRRDANDFSEYLTSRKKAKKVIQKDKVQSRLSRMSLVTKLGHHKTAASQHEETNDFEKVDAQLQLLSCCKKSTSANTTHVETAKSIGEDGIRPD
ncbi:hypothetical protein Acr_14g0000310 [Actinidia rufa]|uniref:Uncharacterized protein n=1 Tax=Actinidia rufa TaxID=165716 RepID=A0A7J0FNV8_9ERIC|nr:hypothetical protein Acr_14g0000310 [Actinidia rufa]